MEYVISIDWNDDGSATAITDNVLEIRWRLGMAQRCDPVSRPAEAQITVSNADGVYSPERGSELSGKWLTIVSDDSGTIRTHFAGIIIGVEPLAGQYGRKTARIFAQGREAELQQIVMRLPALTLCSAGDVISAVLDRAALRRRVLASYCLIDTVGHNLIDSTLIFAPFDDGRVLADGLTLFPLVAADELPALDLIRRIVRAEGGRFFFNRSGEARFVDRHHLLRDDSSAAVFDDNMAGLTYHYGDDVINLVRVRLIPRIVGAAGSILWSLPDVLAIGRGALHRVVASYALDGQPVQALTLELPHPAVHYSATTAATGGNDATADVAVRLIEAGANRALLEIRNHSRSTRYLQQLELRGTPLTISEALLLEKRDGSSQAFYGVRSLLIDVPELSALDEAEALAQAELLRRSLPRGRIDSLTVDARTHPAALALTLLDRIQITEAHTGEDAAWIIIAEAHEVTRGGTRHQITWLLEPADSERFFVIDTHAPDSDRVLLPR